MCVPVCCSWRVALHPHETCVTLGGNVAATHCSRPLLAPEACVSILLQVAAQCVSSPRLQKGSTRHGAQWCVLPRPWQQLRLVVQVSTPPVSWARIHAKVRRISAHSGICRSALSSFLWGGLPLPDLTVKRQQSAGRAGCRP